MSTSIPISGLNEMSIGQLTPDDFFPIVDSASLTTYRLPQHSLNTWFATSGSVLSASFSSASFSSSYAKTASYASTASWASYAVSSSEASHSFTASYAHSTDFATSASWASMSVSTSFTVSSSWANRAEEASSSFISAFAVSASHASMSLSSSYTDQAESSSYARSASYSKSGSYAVTASWARSSSYAFSASYASTSSIATKAYTASYVSGIGSFKTGMVVGYCDIVNEVPNGWLNCDNEVFDESIYPNLANTIGTSYGPTATVIVVTTPETTTTYADAKDGTITITINGGSGVQSLVFSNGPVADTIYYFDSIHGTTHTWNGFAGYGPPNTFVQYSFTVTDIGLSTTMPITALVYYGNPPWTYNTPMGTPSYRTPFLWNGSNGWLTANFTLTPWKWIIKT
jgi:microcystin-dependent protein